MITDGKKWHYLAVKKSSALLRGVTSNHVRDFHLGQKINSKKQENACKNHDYCCIEMPKKRV